ncbi:MAG: hypothetical protein JWR26_4466 [Pedosphaera sp.]|nr:hypothetical protein [Pedosphaera sp.]
MCCSLFIAQVIYPKKIFSHLVYYCIRCLGQRYRPIKSQLHPFFLSSHAPNLSFDGNNIKSNAMALGIKASPLRVIPYIYRLQMLFSACNRGKNMDTVIKK